MPRRRLPAAALLASLALCLGQAAYFYGRLPPVAVSHFDAQGNPNGWMDRSSLIGLCVGTELLIAAVFGIFKLAMSRVPASMMNLPHRELWLAPERRVETLDWISGSMMWMGAATLLLLFDVFGQMFRVNLGAATELSHPRAALGVYLAFSGLWMVLYWRRFSRTPA